MTDGKPVVFVFRYIRYLPIELRRKGIRYISALPGILCFVCADDGQESVSFKELTCRVIPVDREFRLRRRS